MVALVPGPGVLGAHRGGQGLQDRGDHGGAVGGQVAVDDPGAGEGGLDPDLPVLEPGLRVILALGQGPGVDLRGEGSEVFLAGPGPGRGDQDLIGGGPAGPGELAGPLADGPGHRLRHDGALGQGREDLGVGDGAAGPAQMAAGGALGHPGPVDQPRRRAVVRVGGIALTSGERGQVPGTGRGADRVGLLEALQALSLRLGGQRGGVRGGQVPQAGEDLVHRLGGAGGVRKGLHRVLTSLWKELAGRSVRQKGSCVLCSSLTVLTDIFPDRHASQSVLR